MSGEIGYLALGTLPDFREGWAIIPFVEKPHYWREWKADTAPMRLRKNVRTYRSACGFVVHTIDPQKPLVTGNFPKCKRCERSMTEGKR